MVAPAILVPASASLSIAYRNVNSSILVDSHRKPWSISSSLPSPYGDPTQIGFSSKSRGLPLKLDEKSIHDASTSYGPIEAKTGNPPIMPAIFTPGGALDLSSVLFRNRIIFIGQPVNSQVAQRVILQLVTLATIDQDSDILVYLNCPGGSTYSVLAIYDCMSWIKPKVGTVCFGVAASQGALLLAGGEKGMRYAMPNARIMIHQPQSGCGGHVEDVRRQVNEAVQSRHVSEPRIRPMAPPDLPDNRSTDRLTDLEKRMEQTNRDLWARLDQNNRDINDLKCTCSRLEDYLREMDAKLSLLTKEDWGEISNPTIIVAEGAISKSAIGVAEEARTTLVEVRDVADLKVNENDSNKKESSNNDEVATDANRIVEAIAEEGTRGHCVEEMKPSSKPIVLTDSKLQEQLMFPRYLPRNLVTIPALFSVHKIPQTSMTLVTSLILPPFVTDRTHNSRASRVSLILGPKFDSLLELLGEKPSSQNHTLFQSQASNPPSTFAMNTALFAFSMFTASLPSPTFLGPLGASLSTYYFDSVSDTFLGHVFSGYFTLGYLWQVAFGTEIETLSLDHYIIVLSNSINTNSMTIAKVFWGISGRDVEGLGSYFGSLLSMLITPSLAVCVRMFEDLHQVWSDFISIKPKKLIRQFNFSPVMDVVDVNIMRYESSWDEHKKIVQRQLEFSYLVAYESGVFVEDLGYITGYYMIEHSYAARMFYFFESRNSNQNPFVLWGTGGPGCSSELAMSYENDPFKSANNMFLLWIDYGRDRVPNLLDGDQLNGNGFSYTTANDVDTWYNEFFAEYYIPVLTAQLHRGNNAKEGSHINMKDYCGVLGILLPIAFVFYLFFLLNEELKAKFVRALQVVMGFGFLLGFPESFPPVFASLNSKQGPPIKNGLPHSVFVLCYLDALLKLPFLKLQQWVLYGLTWSVTMGLHTEGTFSKLGF